MYPDPTADHGRHAVTLALRPHGSGLTDVRDAAARLNGSLRVIPAVADSGASGDDVLGSVVEITGHGVEVDAVKLADDGSGDLIVRVHEALGNRVPVSVSARQRVGAAWRCDLMESEQVGEEVTVVTPGGEKLYRVERLVD